MTAQSKTTVKSYFITGAKPSQAQFADLIDSYQDANAGLTALTSAVANGFGLLYVISPTEVSASPISNFGRLFVQASAAVSARADLELKAMALVSAVAWTNLDGASIATTAQAVAGTATNLFINPVTMRNAIASAASTPVLSATYESGQLSITNAGTHTLTHGLGAVPKVVQYFLVCTSNDAGYTAGQTVHMGGALFNHVNAGGAESQGASVIISSTQIVIRYISSFTFTILHPTTGAVTSGDITKWALVVRAFA